MSRYGFDEVVLLTGFPYFEARRTLTELLAGPGRAYVHVLVRAKAREDAEAALGALAGDARARVNLLDGDVASIDLGLSGAEWKGLAAEVDRIHHVASMSYLGVERKRAEQVNVGGAMEVLELAAATPQLKCLVHHSSAFVAGDRAGVVRECDLDAGQRFRNVVEETMARAEKLMRRAMDRLPIAVLRPSVIIGDSSTGEVDRLDGPYLLILLILTSPPDLPLPLPARGEVPLQLVPIDYVARAACTIGRDSRAIGRTFHLVDPAPLTARRVSECVAGSGARRMPKGSAPLDIAMALLRTPGLEAFVASPRTFLEALVRPVTFDATNARELLADSDVRCPPFESYVDRVVEHVQRRLEEQRDRRSVAEIDDPLG